MDRLFIAALMYSVRVAYCGFNYVLSFRSPIIFTVSYTRHVVLISSRVPNGYSLFFHSLSFVALMIDIVVNGADTTVP